MKLFDKMLELTESNDDLISEAMLITEKYIYSEILDIDAITKWEEIFRATKEGRKIEFVPYKKTDVPQMIVNDLNFDKAVQRKCEIITTELFENMEHETFNFHVMNIDTLLFEARKN